MLLDLIKKIPGATYLASLPFFSAPYHFLLGFLGALWYGFPSRKLVVIGVTGTKGKTTTCNLLWHILTEAGHKTGLATTVNIRIGKEERVNGEKQTMLGRFGLQKLLAEMVAAGCTHAVVETSSWGIEQYRHRFIRYHAAVLTNLTPEHIEQHGGFDRYRAAKVRFFEHVARRGGGIGVYNLDDPNVGAFLVAPMPARYGYTLHNRHLPGVDAQKTFAVSNVYLGADHTDFMIHGAEARMPLVGEFNVANAAAAAATACAVGVSLGAAAAALRTAPQVSGRMEVVERGGVRVIVDYAHEPASLEAVYRAAKIYNPRRMIGVLGSQGGGRDVWKRAAMGKVAARYLTIAILTNEDPYDEDPMHIIEGVARGVAEENEQTARAGNQQAHIYKILDREAAIQKAIALTEPGDVVLVTGKGGEVSMCVAGGKKIFWSDRGIVEKTLAKRFGRTGGEVAVAV